MLYACKKKRVFEFKKKEGERQELFKKKKTQDWKHQRKELSMHTCLKEEKRERQELFFIFFQEWKHQRRELVMYMCLKEGERRELFFCSKKENFFSIYYIVVCTLISTRAYFFFPKWKQQRR